MINWRIDSAVMGFRMTPEMGEERILPILPGFVVALHKVLSVVRALHPRNYIDLGLSSKMADRGKLCRVRRHCACLEFFGAQAENPASHPVRTKGGELVRPGILAALMAVLVACSSSSPAPPSDPTASAAILKKDCSDPKWREENLGLWYSVCRQPLRW
jgi:hypothetical protein